MSEASAAPTYNGSMMSPEEIERLAQKRAAAKLGWYVHAFVYLAVNGFILVAAYLGIRERTYNPYPALGWGLGLALHYLSVFVLGQGSSFRQQLVQRERERLQRENDRP